MVDVPVQLTAIDRIILESHKQLAEGLSDYLGEGYELVLHSLETLDHSAIKVINGYHTGRSEGAPITDLALNMLAEIRENDSANYISYFCKNRKGEPLKSSTIAIPGERGNIIGLLCINFYINTPFSQILGNFDSDTCGKAKKEMTENFMNNAEDMLCHAVNEVQMEVTKNPAIPVNTKNKEIILRLYDQGIFKLRDSVSRIASILGISKNTVYLHLRNIENKIKNQES